MRKLAVVLATLVAMGLCGCAGVYVAGDTGVSSGSFDAHPASH